MRWLLLVLILVLYVTPSGCTYEEAGTMGIYNPREIASASIVVAASDSLYPEQATPGYKCDGAADDVQINAAIAALPAVGGKVTLLEGNYYIASTITMADNVTLEGAGKGTVLRSVTNSVSITAFADAGGGEVTVTAASHGLVERQGITIAGTTNYNGTYVISYVDANNFKITVTWVSDDATGTVSGNRIVTLPSLGGSDTKLSSLYFRYDTVASTGTAISANGTHRLVVEDCKFSGLQQAIAVVDCWHWRVNNCHFDECGDSSVSAILARNGTVTNCSDWWFLDCTWEPCHGDQIELDSTNTGSNLYGFFFLAPKVENDATSQHVWMKTTGSGTCEEVKIHGGIISNCDANAISAKLTQSEILGVWFSYSAEEDIVLDGSNNVIDDCMFYDNDEGANAHIKLATGSSKNYIGRGNRTSTELSTALVEDLSTAKSNIVEGYMLGNTYSYRNSDIGFASAARTPAISPVNLLNNCDFSQGDPPDWWGAWNATTARSTAQTHDSEYSVYITSSLSWARCRQDVPNFADYQGKWVAFQCWAYAPSQTLDTQKISMKDGVQSEVVSGAIGNDATWRLVQLEMLVDSSATMVRVLLNSNYSATTGTASELYVAEAILIEGRMRDLPAYSLKPARPPSVYEDVGSVLDTLGDCKGLWPFVDSQLYASTAADYSMAGHDLTCEPSLFGWDTSQLGLQTGRLKYLLFNGTDERLYTADHADFTRTATNAFSCGALVYMTDSTNSEIIAKWRQNKREWHLYLNASDYPSFAVYDDTNNAEISREDQTALSQGAWHLVVGVYDGGTDAANLKIYVDGVQTDDADILDEAGFASMVDTDCPVYFGVYKQQSDDVYANYFDGRMALPFFTHTELSASSVWTLWQKCRGLLGL